MILPIADQLRLLNIGGADVRRKSSSGTFALSAGTREIIAVELRFRSDDAPSRKGSYIGVTKHTEENRGGVRCHACHAFV